MDNLHAERLMKLARFLYKLPREKFNYAVVIEGKDIPNDTFSCGTVGCAIGWTPMVFPERFEWRTLKHRVGLFDKADHREMTNGNFVSTAMDFFDLSSSQVQGLFTPGMQDCIGMDDMEDNASPKDVAMMIAAFVKKESTETDTEFTGLFY